jgi:hypothetical protein
VTSYESPGGSTVCATCGMPIDAHNRHVRFQLPDPVLALPDRERTDGTWLSHHDANSSVMMQVPDLGGFVRVLLPVHLTDGYSDPVLSSVLSDEWSHAEVLTNLPESPR